MSLKELIFKSKIDAMKAHDSKRKDALTLVLANIKQFEVDNRKEAVDSDVISMLNKMIKQRKDSIAMYEQAGRTDLADVEKYEVSVITEYLPQQLSDEDVDTVIKETIAKTRATSLKDLGKLMGVLKAELNGKTDIGQVSQKVKTLLS
jgi:uncharacterized protein